MRKLAAGNWKMHGLRASLAEIAALEAQVGDAVEVLICPPATLLPLVPRGRILLGGQDCHPKGHGAHTGDISAAMLAEAGASYVIVGHSERRAAHGETSADVSAKAEAAVAAGLIPIVCVGESLDEREAGRATEVITEMLTASLPKAGTIVVAYEPIWAIGTGAVAHPEQIGEMHQLIRQIVGPGVRILYGGSVKPANADQVFSVANVDGALVGGASLTATDFLPIIEALGRAQALGTIG